MSRELRVGTVQETVGDGSEDGSGGWTCLPIPRLIMGSMNVNVWGKVARRPWLVANRATLPQKWPPPPDSCKRTERLNQRSFLFFMARLLGHAALDHGLHEGERPAVQQRGRLLRVPDPVSGVGFSN